MSTTELYQLRQEIDRINLKLLTLLSQRGDYVREIYKVKVSHSMNLYEPEREDAQLEQLLSMNRGPYSNQQVAHLFREIFRASLQLMKCEDTSAIHLSRGEGDK